jgi:hypothetical protein
VDKAGFSACSKAKFISFNKYKLRSLLCSILYDKKKKVKSTCPAFKLPIAYRETSYLSINKTKK